MIEFSLVNMDSLLPHTGTNPYAGKEGGHWQSSDSSSMDLFVSDA